MSRGLSLAVAIGLSALACGGSRAPVPAPGTGSAPPPDAAPPPPDAPLPLDRDLARLATRSVQLYADVAEALRIAGEDCAAAAARVGELQRAYADVTAANAKVLHEGRGGELKAALEPHAAQFDAAAQQIVGSPTLATCVNDEAFTRAFDDLVGAPP